MHSIITYDLMVLAVGAIAFGFYLLMKGGDWSIDAAVFLAKKAGLSKLFVGATILAFGTSVPELFASVNANFSGFPGIALGNVIGSNVANILLVLGATALVYPVFCTPKAVLADMVMMLIATLALLGAMQFEVIGRGTGLAFFCILICFVVYQFKLSKTDVAAPNNNTLATSATALTEILSETHKPGYRSTATAVGFLFGGFSILALGSELLVKGAVTIGITLGISEAIIGMTVVAFGTSLPELATCVAAAAKKHTEMLVGNIIGSNVFNILSIVGVTAVLKPLVVDHKLTGVSLWTMVIVAFASAAWLLKGRTINRNGGILMISLYVIFIAAQYFV